MQTSPPGVSAAAKFFKVASSKNTQALSRALVRVRASVSSNASVSDTLKDGRIGSLPTCNVGSSNCFTPETPVYGSSVEMHLRMNSQTHGLSISCPQVRRWAHSLTHLSSIQPNGSIQEANMLTHRPLQTPQQSACPPNKDESDILTDACSESLRRHMGILGVSATLRTNFSTRNIRVFCQGLGHFGVTICARHFHSGRTLQQQFPAFATEQEEESSTTASSAGSSANPGSTGDEGLEIAKLPISRILVDSLARRGITRLFPIQVCAWITWH